MANYTNSSGQIRLGWRTAVVTQVVNAVDADAQTFISAAGITDLTQAAAISTLVNDLKTYGLWTKMKALYPFVGGSAASHKFNLKDPRDLDAAYRLVFNGGWVHSSTGAKPNGINTYADTKLAPNAMGQNSIHASFYSRTDISGNYWDLGAYSVSGGGVVIGPRYQNGSSLVYMNIKSNDSAIDNNPTIGLYMGNRTSSTTNTLFRNGVIIVNGTKSSFPPISLNIYLGGDNEGTVVGYSPREQAFASIGDGLSDSESANFYTSVQKFNTTLGRQVGTPAVSDSDAQAFLNSAGITDLTQTSAINTLVTDLKSAGVWTKIMALYPFVGGTATSHKFNLKDPRDLDAAYRLVFNGGWIHSPTGAKPNGVNGWADSKFAANILSPGNAHMSYYNRTIDKANGYLPVIQDNSPWNASKTVSLGVGNVNNGGVVGVYFAGVGASSTTVKSTAWTSFTIGTSTATNLHKIYNSGVLQGTSTTNSTTTFSTSNLVIGAHDGSLNYTNSQETAFVSFGIGLSDSDVVSFNTAVQKYQTTLGRQTDVPLVSDSDAQSFLTAAGITSYTQASAINTLVVDLKAAGVWSKMKALYPFVGGTATSHKFNLKDPRDVDAAYRLVFNGGWAHSSTGALPNGTTGYANTYLNPYTNLSTNNTHDSIYINNNISSYTTWPGFGVMSSATSAFYTHIKTNGNYYSYIGLEQATQNGIIYSNDSNQGFYINSRISSTSLKGYKNGITKNSTSVLNTGSLPSNHYYYGVRNMDSATYNNYSHSFASIGDGLTDTESTSFYNAVQKFNTSLGRQVGTPVYNTNGLVLNLDAGNANSYPGTGTTWFDLASGNNGTLVNGPTYNTTNGGSINFDGINDNVTFGTNCFGVALNDTISEFTINVWANWNSFPNNTHDEIVSWWASGTQTYLDGFLGVSTTSYLGFTNANPTLRFGDGWQDTGVRFNSSTDTNKWWNITAIKTATNAYIYLNGILVSTKGSALSWGFNNVLNIGSQFTAGEYLNGKLSSVSLYNRALSATEVLQNFNNTRGRFGL